MMDILIIDESWGESTKCEIESLELSGKRRDRVLDVGLNGVSPIMSLPKGRMHENYDGPFDLATRQNNSSQSTLVQNVLQIDCVSKGLVDLAKAK